MENDYESPIFRLDQVIIKCKNLLDHRLQGRPILPGSTLIIESTLLLPSNREKNFEHLIFEDIFLQKPVFLPPESDELILQRRTQIQIADGEEHGGRTKLEVLSHQVDNEQAEQPILSAYLSPSRHHHIGLSPPKPPFPHSASHSQIYKVLCTENGYDYGPGFRVLARVDYSIGYAEGRPCAWGKCNVEPAMALDVRLDALWQAMVFCALINEKGEKNGGTGSGEAAQNRLLVPFSICRLKIHRRLSQLLRGKMLTMAFMVYLEETNPKGNCWVGCEGDDGKGREDENVLLLEVRDIIFRRLPRKMDNLVVLDSRSIGVPGKEHLPQEKEEEEKAQLKVLVRSMSLRLPGEIHSPEQFWAVLCQGQGTDGRVPARRMAERNWLARGGEGNVPVEGGHFLRHDLARFDANFFGVSAMETAAMDPQQRLLLECVWECLENAGCVGGERKKELAEAGFFIGFMGTEYGELEKSYKDSNSGGNALQMLGLAASTVSGRLAHFFDSRGPALSVDTACSSSLVALQLAVDAIRSGRCGRAIVGGVSLTLSAQGLVQRANAGMLSRDGRCRPFDAAASGYGRADGCAVLLLEAVPQDQVHKWPHWAVLEAIESGHDGRSAALTAPNGLAQQQLLQRCLGQLSSAQLAALRCWECHGTGTALGDPVEMLALAKAVHTAAGGTGMSGPVLIGAAKANVGHTEAASGLVGLIKAVLQLHHAFVPPLAHFRRLNPEIEKGMRRMWGPDEDQWPVRLATGRGGSLAHNGHNWTSEKQKPSSPLLAGVSSFGVAGTLACALLSVDSAIRPSQVHRLKDLLATHCPHRWQCVLPLSAKCQLSLEKSIRRHLSLFECLARRRLSKSAAEKKVEEEKDWPLHAFCAAGAIHRQHGQFPDHRAAFLLMADQERKTPPQSPTVEIVRKQFSRIRFRLAFWTRLERAFHGQVPLYRFAFRSLLRSVGLSSEEEKLLGCSQRQLSTEDTNLLRLADTFARFRTLIRLGLIRKNSEIGVYSGQMALNLLRELLWTEGTLPAPSVRKCLEAMERQQQQEEQNNDSNNCWTDDAFSQGGEHSEELVILPAGGQQTSPSFPFASLHHPDQLAWLLAHCHCAGGQSAAEWASVFPLPRAARVLLSLVPLPNYAFDRSTRFWTGRDDWLAQWDHPLLGSRPRDAPSGPFEGLLCARWTPWLGQLRLRGRPLLLSFGPLLEMLAAAGLARFHNRSPKECRAEVAAFCIQFREFNAIEIGPEGREWLRTEIVEEDVRRRGGRLVKVAIFGGDQRRVPVCRADIITSTRWSEGEEEQWEEENNEFVRSERKDRREQQKEGEERELDSFASKLGLSFGSRWQKTRSSWPLENGRRSHLLMRLTMPRGRLQLQNSPPLLLANPMLLEMALIQTMAFAKTEAHNYEEFIDLVEGIEVIVPAEKANYAEGEDSEEKEDDNAEENEESVLLERKGCGGGIAETILVHLAADKEKGSGRPMLRIHLRRNTSLEAAEKEEITPKAKFSANRKDGKGVRQNENGQSNATEEGQKMSSQRSQVELVAQVHNLVCLALPSGRMPSADWTDQGLIQLGLDSLALIALVQTLNRHFRLKRQITAGEVFGLAKAGDLVKLIGQRMAKQEEEKKNGEEEENKEENVEERGKRPLAGERQFEDEENGNDGAEGGEDELEEEEEEEEEADYGIMESANEGGTRDGDAEQQSLFAVEKMAVEEDEGANNALWRATMASGGILLVEFKVRGGGGMDQREGGGKTATVWLKLWKEGKMMGQWPLEASPVRREEDFDGKVLSLGQILSDECQKRRREVGCGPLRLQIAAVPGLTIDNELDDRDDGDGDDDDDFGLGLLMAFSSALLLFAKAIVRCPSPHWPVECRLPPPVDHCPTAADDDSLLLAFSLSFLQSLQAEIGANRFRLIQAVDFRFCPMSPVPMEDHKQEGSRKKNKKKRGTSWLITGGTGGIGLEMALWLVRHFRPHSILLLARNRPHQRNQRFWTALQQMNANGGCRVELVLADVANRAQLEAIFNGRAEMRHLFGVIHSAGTLLNIPLTAMDPESAAQLVRPKAGGALLLHRLIRKYGLRPVHFIVNSSLASLHPSPGQSAYAAANALCDALILRRRAHGLAGTSLNWANWLQVGMAADRPGVNQRLHWLGLPGLPTATALRCLRLALLLQRQQHHPCQWLLLKADWERLRVQQPGLFQKFVFQPSLAESSYHRINNVNEHSAKLSVILSVAEIEGIVRRVLAQQLNEGGGGSGPWRTDEADLCRTGFMELGLDSLRLYQFAGELGRALGPLGLGQVSVLDLFERTNARMLAEDLAERQQKGEIGKMANELEKQRAEREEQKYEEEEEKEQIYFPCEESVSNSPFGNNKEEREQLACWHPAEHHRLQGIPIVPAALQLQQFWRHSSIDRRLKKPKQLENIRFQRTLPLEEWKGVRVVERGNERELWLLGEHGEGQKPFSQCQTGPAPAEGDQQQQQQQWPERQQVWSLPQSMTDLDFDFDVNNFYRTLCASGMDYGPKMQLIGRARVALKGEKGDHEGGPLVYAKMRASAANCQQQSNDKCLQFPFWLLAEFALQTLAIGVFRDNQGNSAAEVFLPVGIDRLRCLASEDVENGIKQGEIVAVGKVTSDDGLGPFVCGNVSVYAGGGGEDLLLLLCLDGICARRCKLLAEEERRSRRRSSPESVGVRNEEEEVEQQMADWLSCIRPDHDLAIISMSGTFSGCRSVSHLWEALLRGGPCLSTLAPHFSSDRIPAGLVPLSGVCPDCEHFDLDLFASAGLSPAEWRRLDPQIRLLAEHGFSALEQSGHGNNVGQPTRLRIGCFMAAEPSPADYAQSGDQREAALGSLLGMHRRNQNSFCAQWLSHLLGLSGPSVSVYSACSSSLSALAQAQAALLTGQADLCLAGAVHLVHPSQIGHQPVSGQPLCPSTEARCWPFCSQSGGIVRGSGCAIVVLRRAKEAIAAGDPILGILRSVALSQDGAFGKPSFMAPSLAGQREAIRLALAQSDIAKEAIAFWECHATGTTLGDSVELAALHSAFFEADRAENGIPKLAPLSANSTGGTGTRRAAVLSIGSSKASVGHCFAASGFCALAKLLQMLRTRLVPAQLLPPQYSQDQQQPDLLSPFQGQLEVNAGKTARKLAKLPLERNIPLSVGASCFGIGGTNGALVLMEGPPDERIRPPPMAGEEEQQKQKEEEEEALIGANNSQFQLFPLSAASRPALKSLCGQLARHVQGMCAEELSRVANTLQRRRAELRFRAFVLASDSTELAGELSRIAAAAAADSGEEEGREKEQRQLIVDSGGGRRQLPELALFFGPQGVQFPGMFSAECALSPFLAAHFARLVGLPPDWPIAPSPSRSPSFSSTVVSSPFAVHNELVQPHLFAVGHSLLAFLREAGLPGPALLFGHSLGELTAICAAGGFSPANGIRLLRRRGRLVQSTAPARMLMLRDEGKGQAEEESCSSSSALLAAGLCLSARLSPSLSTFVGPPSTVRSLVDQIPTARVLDKIEHGFHSRQFMGPILSQFRRAMEEELDWSPFTAENTQILSNLDGRPIKSVDQMGADYLVRHMAEPVRLDLCLSTLLRDFPQVRLLLEIGPPGILRQIVRESETALGLCSSAAEGHHRRLTVISTMRRGEWQDAGPPQLLIALGQLWQHGIPLNFARIFGIPAWDWDQRVPGYQFQRTQLNPSGEEQLIPFPETGRRLDEECKRDDEKITNEEAKSLGEQGKERKKDRQEREEVVQLVAQLWREHLPSPARGPPADFLSSGGNSLQAAQICWELECRLRLAKGALQLDTLFQHSALDDFVGVVWALVMGQKDKEENKKIMPSKLGQQQRNAALTGLEMNGLVLVENTSEGSGSGESTRDHSRLHFLRDEQMLLLALRPPPAMRPLLHVYCVHPISGTALVYRQLAQLLPPWAAVFGVQFAQRETVKISSLVELAQFYANKICAHAGHEMPILPIGHSLGGVLAREIGIALNQWGRGQEKKPFSRKIPLAVLFDSWAVGQRQIQPERVRHYVQQRFRHFCTPKLAEGAQTLATLLQKHEFKRSANSPDLWLFRASERTKLPFSDFIDNSHDAGWAQFCQELHLVECDTDHDGILEVKCLQEHRKTLEQLCHRVKVRHCVVECPK